MADASRPSSPQSCLHSKRKYIPEEKSKDKLPAYYYFSELSIDYYLKMGDISCAIFFINKRTSSKSICD